MCARRIIIDNMSVENKQQVNETGSSGSEADSTLSQSLRRRWNGIVDLSLANVPLLACCFVTGLLDTTMFQGRKTYNPASSNSANINTCSP